MPEVVEVEAGAVVEVEVEVEVEAVAEAEVAEAVEVEVAVAEAEVVEVAKAEAEVAEAVEVEAPEQAVAVGRGSALTGRRWGRRGRGWRRGRPAGQDRRRDIDVERVRLRLVRVLARRGRLRPSDRRAVQVDPDRAKDGGQEAGDGDRLGRRAVVCAAVASEAAWKTTSRARRSLTLAVVAWETIGSPIVTQRIATRGSAKRIGKARERVRAIERADGSRRGRST